MNNVITRRLPLASLLIGVLACDERLHGPSERFAAEFPPSPLSSMGGSDPGTVIGSLTISWGTGQSSAEGDSLYQPGDSLPIGPDGSIAIDSDGNLAITLPSSLSDTTGFFSYEFQSEGETVIGRATMFVETDGSSAASPAPPVVMSFAVDTTNGNTSISPGSVLHIWPNGSLTRAASGNIEVTPPANYVTTGTLNYEIWISGTASTGAVTIDQPLVATVVVTPANDTLAVNASLPYAALPRDAAGTALHGRTVTWTSDAPSIATVDQQGLVTAVASGSATITATSDGVDGSTTVTVFLPSTDIYPGDDIQTAVDAHPAGTAFRIMPGIHRLQSVDPKSGNVFAGEPGAILSGAKLLTDFEVEGAYWVVHGQTQENRRHGWDVWGDEVCAEGRLGCIYPEDLFFNDVPLEQVTTLGDVEPGTWYFDYGADKIYLTDDPTGHVVEISATEFAIRGEFTHGLEVRGLVIEKYANAGQLSAVAAYNSDAVVFEDNEVRFNHGMGLRIVGGTNSRMVNNFVHHQGQLGVGSFGATGLLVEGNELSENGYAGYSMYWEAGGSKFVFTQDLVVRNNNVHDNLGNGLWTDIDNVNTLHEGNISTGNLRNGIYHEVSYDAVIRNNTTSNNGEAGISVQHSPNVEVYGNTVTDNTYGILAVQRDRGSGRFGPYEIENLHVHDNVVTMTDGYTGLRQYVNDDSYFSCRNVRFENNTYSLGSNPTYFAWDNGFWTLAEWQGFGHDGGTSDSLAAIVVTPDSATIIEGDTLRLLAEPQDSAGNVLSRVLTWSSDDATVATVDGDGMVTAIGVGDALVSARCGTVEGSASVTVTPTGDTDHE